MKTKVEAKEAFMKRLTRDWKAKYIEGKLLEPGKRFMFVNKNGKHSIEIVSYDEDNVEVEILISDENTKELWTLDNLFIFDSEYIQHLCENAKDYRLLNEDKWKGENYIMEPGVYILHNVDEPSDKGYYIGQAKGKSGGLSGRLYDHERDSDSRIDKAIHDNKQFSLKVINIADTDYDEINALEAALIGHYNSYCGWSKEGYNANRGQNCAGQRAYTPNLI
ncbi:MAG: GIY-YIG nuclease family protein [Ruminococcus sp.]|nr:GIY-YIG nuclease family protein [Ruminococcus sp.]